MRLLFSNISRPKDASKIVAAITNRKLSSCQKAVALICRYRDWHELESSVSIAHTSSVTPNAHPIEPTLKLAEILQVSWGDALYALTASRLWGPPSREPQFHLEQRIALFERTDLKPSKPREPGAIGRVKSAGWSNEPVILKSFKRGGGAKIITHKHPNSVVADFEYVSPRHSVALFIPMRFYLPYGHWSESDGARVIFSRDYLPMWRLREGQTPERMNPLERIKGSQEFYWNDGNTPWNSRAIYDREIERLRSFRLLGLPKIVDTLPMFVRDDRLSNIKDALDQLGDGAQIP